MNPPARKPVAPPSPAKQKRQLVLLSALSVVFVGILYVQFTGSEEVYELAALTDVSLTAEFSSPEVASSDAPVPAATAPGALDNPVLYVPFAQDTLPRNPFQNFWAAPGENRVIGSELPPPAVTLQLTMPSSARPVAVIDGVVHFIGDAVEGWTIAEIRERSVLLRSDSNATVVLGMPTLPVGRSLPAPGSN